MRRASRPKAAAVEVSGCMLTDIGLERELNEDRAAYVIPRAPDPRACFGMLALVADGMGGHAAGEVASEMAADTVVRTYYDAARAGGDRHGALRRAFAAANRQINDSAHQDASRRGMGTTCTALAIHDGLAYAAHVGDSRLYLLRGGWCRLLTDDHTFVMELVRAGHISREQAHTHPDRNVIVRALGTRPEVETAVWRAPMPVAPGDRFLLCSDGLSDAVGEDEIASRLQALDPARACRSLLDLALEAGGHDNVTVGVFAIAAARPERAGVRATRTHRTAGAEP